MRYGQDVSLEMDVPRRSGGSSGDGGDMDDDDDDDDDLEYISDGSDSL